MVVAVFPKQASPLKPPRHLKAAGRELWSDIVRQYHISDGAGLALVGQAAECLDTIRAAQAEVRERGMLVLDRYQVPKQNPAIAVERDARAGMISALRALHLDVEPLRDRGRAPGSTVFEKG
jgi:phage terminase small subunit